MHEQTNNSYNEKTSFLTSNIPTKTKLRLCLYQENVDKQKQAYFETFLTRVNCKYSKRSRFTTSNTQTIHDIKTTFTKSLTKEKFTNCLIQEYSPNQELIKYIVYILQIFLVYL